MDVELLQDVGDVGRDGSPGQHKPGGDLRVGQSLLHECGDLDLGRGEAVPAALRPPVLGVRPAPDAVGAEGGLDPGYVRGRAQGGVDLHGPGERVPRLAAVAGVDEVPGGRLQRLRAQQGPSRFVITLCRGEQPGGIMVQQTAAIERVRLPVGDLRFGGERGGLARDSLRGLRVAGLGSEADGVGQQVLELLGFFCIAAERTCQRGQRLR